MTTGPGPDERQPEGATIFVSYASGDRKHVVPIIELLEQAGYSVWWDGLIEGGQRFSHKIEAALEAARVVVVLWSETSSNSAWVQDEAARGRDLHRLVPLSIDGTHPPLGFRQIQTIRLSGAGGLQRGDPAVESFLRAVAALHDQPFTPVNAQPRRPARAFDRRLFIAGGAAVLAAAGVGGAWWAGLFSARHAAANSVAVLPFVNMSGDANQAYFSDGLAAEIRSELARNPLLQVAAQTSSTTLRARGADARATSETLSVAYLLDGNVRRSGNTVRVSAELIDGRSGFSKWAQSFDRPLADVFAVQDEIAGAVATALTAQVLKGEQRPSGGAAAAETGGTANVAAYDAYLRGKDLFGQAADEAADRAALARFDEALLADPRYGAAHAARSRSLTVIANQYVQGPSRRDLYREALAAANRAVIVSPSLADAHSALGFALFNGKLDDRAARGPFDRSYELGKGDADVLSRYAIYCARSGRFEEARSAIARSISLDPLNGHTYRLMGEVEYSARAFAAAIGPSQRALALSPGIGVASSLIGASQLMLGKMTEARKAYTAEPNSLFGLTGLAIVLRREGRDVEARAALARLVAEHGDDGLYQQAQVYAQWGETGRALSTLAQAYVLIDAGLMYSRNDPFLDSLRGAPEFIRLLKSLGYG